MTCSDLSDVHVTILAGGSGTRLWPRSRQGRPKQFLNLIGESSMLQQTVERILPLVPPERVYILTGPEHANLIHEQLPQIPTENIWIEPSPKGTAPCLGLAAMRLSRLHGEKCVMISLHADHRVAHEERFRRALAVAVDTARQGYLVTIGIIPSAPETGFGYIERGTPLGQKGELEIYRVVRFTEKPPLEQAKEFVASGRFYWNTGYFVWTLERILDAFQRLQPELYAHLHAIAAGAESEEALQSLWEEITPLTIDVGIMERASDIAVIPCDLGWNDIGSWASLFDILPHDHQDNLVLGKGQHIGLDTSGSLIYSEGRLVATIGLQDMIVVDTGDALLVLPKSRAQDVSVLVKELRTRGLQRYL